MYPATIAIKAALYANVGEGEKEKLVKQVGCKRVVQTFSEHKTKQIHVLDQAREYKNNVFEAK